MKLTGYVRVSRIAGREGERFISPGEQRKAIEGWCSLHGHELAGIIEDLDQPGTRRDRPGLEKVMARVAAREVEGVVVARLDRFGRSVPHLAQLVEQLQLADAGLFTVAEGIDSRGATGRMLLTILSAIAEFEVTRISDTWAAARTNAVERGVFVGGTVPLGYTKRDDGRLVPDDEAQVVQSLFTRRAGGESWASLARSCSRSVGAMRHLIANRTYLGEVHGGGDLIARGAHEPLIDRALFEKANATKGLAPPRSGRASGLLSGILRCAGCRYAMKINQNTGSGKPFLEYRCKASRSENAGACSAGCSISAHVIEPFVLDAFFGGLGDYRARGYEMRGELDAARQQLFDAEALLDQLLESELGQIIDDHSRFERHVRERQAAVSEARTAFVAAQEAATPMHEVDFTTLWPDLSLQEQRHLLASTLDCVFVRRGTEVAERTFICWRGEAPELPTRGRRWTPAPFHFDAAAEAALEHTG